jgi:hypothetical protein
MDQASLPFGRMSPRSTRPRITAGALARLPSSDVGPATSTRPACSSACRGRPHARSSICAAARMRSAAFSALSSAGAPRRPRWRHCQVRPAPAARPPRAGRAWSSRPSPGRGADRQASACVAASQWSSVELSGRAGRVWGLGYGLGRTASRDHRVDQRRLRHRERRGGPQPSPHRSRDRPLVRPGHRYVTGEGLTGCSALSASLKANVDEKIASLVLAMWRAGISATFGRRARGRRPARRPLGDQHMTMSMNLSGVCAPVLSCVVTNTAFGFGGVVRSNTPTVLPGASGDSQVDPT